VSVPTTVPDHDSAAAAEATAARGVFSCVVDADPRFHLDALRWYATLSRIVGVDSQDMVVHVVGGAGSDVLAYLRSMGVTTVDVAAFDARSPHCNKISGALALAERGVNGLAVLSDTDVVFLEEPRRLRLEPRSMGMRVVGGGNPPLRVLENVFLAARVDLPGQVELELGPGERTLDGHANGGVYLVPGEILTRIGQSWSRWARWVLDNLELLERWTTFVDQTAMTLALADEGVSSHWLGIRWNFPSQNAKRIPAGVEAPSVVHYHKHVTSEGLLGTTGIDVVDRRISTANTAITQVWHEAFPNGPFRDWRDRSDPDRGSGEGGRGHTGSVQTALRRTVRRFTGR
jgi:hypothetical protein